LKQTTLRDFEQFKPLVEQHDRLMKEFKESGRKDEKAQ
jgi:hypothetical protein